MGGTLLMANSGTLLLAIDKVCLYLLFCGELGAFFTVHCDLFHHKNVY